LLSGESNFEKFTCEKEFLAFLLSVQFSKEMFGLKLRQDALSCDSGWGLGGSPVLDIVTYLKWKWGVRLYIRPLDSKISGLFAFNEKIGPCILLNAKHTKERRSQTAAHECGHFISTRNQPEVLFEVEKR